MFAALGPYKILIAAALVPVIFFIGYFKGKGVATRECEFEKAEAAREFAEYQAKVAEERAVINDQVITKYVDRVRVVKEKSDAVIREVPIYIADSDTCPAGFRVLHDAAALQNELPGAAAGTDGAAAGNP